MKKIFKRSLLAVIVVAIAYFGWGKLEEILVNRAITKKLAEAGMSPEREPLLDQGPIGSLVHIRYKKLKEPPCAFLCIFGLH